MEQIAVRRAIAFEIEDEHGERGLGRMGISIQGRREEMQEILWIFQ